MQSCRQCILILVGSKQGVNWYALALSHYGSCKILKARLIFRLMTVHFVPFHIAFATWLALPLYFPLFHGKLRLVMPALSQ